MRYALLVDGVVTNIVCLLAFNAADFPGSVQLDERPVVIGDTYANNVFYHNGAEVLSPQEALTAAELEIAALDAALLESEYQNIIGGLES